MENSKAFKKAFKMKQIRRALQLWAQTVTDESTMMEVADVYPKWSGKSKTYKIGMIVSHGVNGYGETQLYTVLQDHTSQEGWTPEASPALFKKVGFTDDGTSIWTQPLCASDAYDTGDVVSHNGVLYESTVDANVWEPGVYGWAVKES